jgi:hypothetical protein
MRYADGTNPERSRVAGSDVACWRFRGIGAGTRRVRGCNRKNLDRREVAAVEPNDGQEGGEAVPNPDSGVRSARSRTLACDAVMGKSVVDRPEKGDPKRQGGDQAGRAATMP